MCFPSALTTPTLVFSPAAKLTSFTGISLDCYQRTVSAARSCRVLSFPDSM